MVGGCSALGDDFQAGAAGTGKARGVRIVVDLYFLDGGGSDTGSIGLDAVDDECDPVGSGSVVVEEAGHGGDVILIEDRDAVERVAVDGVGVLVFRTLGADEGGRSPGSNGDGFVGNCDLKDDSNGNLRLGVQACVDAGVTETLSVELERVVAGCELIEVERTGGVRGCLSKRFAVRGQERHLRIGDRSARGVDERTGNGARSRRGRLVFGKARPSGAGGPIETLAKQQGRGQNAHGRYEDPKEERLHSSSLQKISTSGGWFDFMASRQIESVTE